MLTTARNKPRPNMVGPRESGLLKLGGLPSGLGIRGTWERSVPGGIAAIVPASKQEMDCQIEKTQLQYHNNNMRRIDQQQSYNLWGNHMARST